MKKIELDIVQIKKFLLTGGGATICHLGMMWFLVWFGFNATLSSSVGVIIGAVVNYIFQYHYTFESDTKHSKSIRNYLITVMLSFVSNLILFMFFHEFLKINVLFSQLLTSAMVALQNYIIYKKFVFLKEGAIYEA